MNKKEIAEIKKNFSDDCNFFTINRVVTAFVDAEKNIKCKTNQLYNIMPQDESELILANLKKTLSGKIGVPAEQLKAELEAGKFDSALAAMNGSEAAKFRRVVNDPKLIEKMMSTPQAQALYKKLSGK